MSQKILKSLIKNIVTEILIFETKNKQQEPPKAGYHVTYLSNLKNIQKNGLKLPESGHDLTTSVGDNAIYLFTDRICKKYSSKKYRSYKNSKKHKKLSTR